VETQLKAYLVYNHLPTFVFDNAESECADCEYRVPQQLPTGEIYIGQWKNDQKFGRGTEISTDGVIRQGYYKDGLFVGKRREIDIKGSTKEWTSDGQLTQNEYLCMKSTSKCWIKPEN